MHDYFLALIGGLMIGAAASIMLLFNGRVTGISGIVAGLVRPPSQDSYWRLAFVVGLLVGGLILNYFVPQAFSTTHEVSNLQIVLAGVLVGFGTLLGGGCTSGHGVCGISRRSPRSLVATVIFISAGALMVLILKYVVAL